MQTKILTVLGSVVGMIFYIVCLWQSACIRGYFWRITPYAIALAPAAIHAYNYGWGYGTLFTVVLFLGLTKLLVYLVKKECGDDLSDTK